MQYFIVMNKKYILVMLVRTYLLMCVHHFFLVVFTSVIAIALIQHGPTIDGRKTLALMCKLLINITYSTTTVAQEQIAGTYFQ